MLSQRTWRQHVIDGYWRGRGGTSGRQGVEENSRAGIKTRHGHAFALKGYSSLFLLPVANTKALACPAVGNPSNFKTSANRERRKRTVEVRRRNGVHRNARRRWQLPLIEVEIPAADVPNRLKCPIRRAPRGRGASARTAAETSRKMEAVRQQREARPPRLQPPLRLGRSAPAVRDVEKFRDVFLEKPRLICTSWAHTHRDPTNINTLIHAWNKKTKYIFYWQALLVDVRFKASHELFDFLCLFIDQLVVQLVALI